MTMPSQSKDRTRLLQILCELIGVIAVASAAFMIWIPLGLLVMGAWMIIVANAKVGT